MEPIDHREHHVVVSWLLWGFCPFRTKRHRRVEDVVIPDNTYLKVWLRFYSGIWICLPSNKVFTKTVSCRVMARGSQNLVIKGLKCIIIDIFFTLYVPNIAAWFCSDAGRKKVARRWNVWTEKERYFVGEVCKNIMIAPHLVSYRWILIKPVCWTIIDPCRITSCQGGQDGHAISLTKFIHRLHGAPQIKAALPVTKSFRKQT